MLKIGGVKAAADASLSDVQAAAQKAIDAGGSIGVGLVPCTLRAIGHPNLETVASAMEVGIGHHSEAGVRVEPVKPARPIEEDMTQIVLDDHVLPAGTDDAVLLSSLGVTIENELCPH